MNLLTKKEVADMLKISVHAVSHLHQTKQLEGMIVCRKLRFTEDSVKEYLEKCKKNY